MITRRRFVLTAATAALAPASLAAAPAAAFATDATSGTLTPSATAITVLTGDSTNLGQYFTVNGLSPAGSDAHLDFVMGPSTAAASVNKHSGAYVATSEGVSTVTVYLMAGTVPQGNPGKPDTGVPVLDQKTITVTATSQNAGYGFQGAGSNPVMVTSPAVSGWTQTATGYENELSAPVLDDGYYYVTYQQNAGFRDHDGAAAYQAWNAGNITLTYDGGTAVLGSSDVLTVASAVHATKTVVLKIDAAAVTLGDCELAFDPDLRGNNETSTLGSEICFLIDPYTIKSSISCANGAQYGYVEGATSIDSSFAVAFMGSDPSSARGAWVYNFWAAGLNASRRTASGSIARGCFTTMCLQAELTSAQGSASFWMPPQDNGVYSAAWPSARHDAFEEASPVLSVVLDIATEVIASKVLSWTLIGADIVALFVGNSDGSAYQQAYASRMWNAPDDAYDAAQYSWFVVEAKPGDVVEVKLTYFLVGPGYELVEPEQVVCTITAPSTLNAASSNTGVRMVKDASAAFPPLEAGANARPNGSLKAELLEAAEAQMDRAQAVIARLSQIKIAEGGHIAVIEANEQRVRDLDGLLDELRGTDEGDLSALARIAGELEALRAAG